MLGETNKLLKTGSRLCPGSVSVSICFDPFYHMFQCIFCGLSLVFEGFWKIHYYVIHKKILYLGKFNKNFILKFKPIDLKENSNLYNNK